MNNDNLSNNAGRLIDEGREKINEYADKGMEYVSSANSAMISFIREGRILAMATIFAAGYLVARMLNGLTRR